MNRPEISTKNPPDVVADLLLDIHRGAETILIVVTHSKELAARFPQRFELRNQHLEPL